MDFIRICVLSIAVPLLAQELPPPLPQVGHEGGFAALQPDGDGAWLGLGTN